MKLYPVSVRVARPAGWTGPLGLGPSRPWTGARHTAAAVRSWTGSEEGLQLEVTVRGGTVDILARGFGGRT